MHLGPISPSSTALAHLQSQDGIQATVYVDLSELLHLMGSAQQTKEHRLQDTSIIGWSDAMQCKPKPKARSYKVHHMHLYSGPFTCSRYLLLPLPVAPAPSAPAPVLGPLGLLLPFFSIPYPSVARTCTPAPWPACPAPSAHPRTCTRAPWPACPAPSGCPPPRSPSASPQKHTPRLPWPGRMQPRQRSLQRVQKKEVCGTSTRVPDHEDHAREYRYTSIPRLF